MFEKFIRELFKLQSRMGQMPAGRPSKYKSEFCEKVIESLGQGKSIEKFCANNDISVSMFKRYREDHEEFRAAVEIGEAKRNAWWQDLGIKNIYKKSFNPNLYKFLVYWTCGVCEKKEIDKTVSTKDESVRAVKTVQDLYA